MLMLIFASSAASAETVETDEIDKGEAYQFDNYVLEVDSVTDFSVYSDEINETQMNVNLKLYRVNEKGDLEDVKDPDHGAYSSGTWRLRNPDYDSSRSSFTVSDGIPEGEVTVSYVDASHSSWAILNVETSWSTEFTQYIDSPEKASYIDEPSLVVTKEVDRDEVDSGEMVTVTVKARNAGGVKATDISVKNPLDEGFQLEEWIVDESMTPSEIGKNDMKTLLKYNLKAVGTGNKNLSEVVVNYGREADDETYSSYTSTEPSVFINPTEAKLAASMELDDESIQTGETVRVRVLLESRGEKDADEITVKIDAPEGAGYVGLVGEEEPDDGGPTVDTIGGNNPQISLPQAVGVGEQRELLVEFSMDEPGEYKFGGEVVYDTGNRFTGKATVDLGENDLRVGETMAYTATHQPVHVYATPVLVFAGILGWVLYRRQQYKF